ncbi:MAG: spheroidene monooxygenase [Microthrixaceae bacterium]
MSVVSVHIADVGLPKSLGLIRHPRPASIPGLLSANAGLAATFGTTPARPSPGRVGLIAFWQHEAALEEFEATHPRAAALGGGLVVHARPLRIHGAWPGIDDNVPKQRNVEHDGPVLVLTLAKTRFSRFVPFFRASQPAEKAVRTAPGNVFSSAVLRPPFISSVSLWESSDSAMDYAYSGHQAGHPEAIAAGRAKPFHHQQAFIRLAITELRGSLAGHNPLPEAAVRLSDS